MNDKFSILARKRDAMVLFRPLIKDEAFCALMDLLSISPNDIGQWLMVYSDVAAGLYNCGETDLSRHILKITLECETAFTKLLASGQEPSKVMQECLMNELTFIQEVSQLSSMEMLDRACYTGYAPMWTVSETDIPGSYSERLLFSSKTGFGKWSQSNMFIYRDKEIIPVKNPDPQRLNQLFGYERQRQAVIDNTIALLKGKPAQNVLLYGDAGTGKSSTVKAIVNEFYSAGLRLIEITKEQLRDIPRIVDEISSTQLKFILFIDDLTFTAGEDGFGALKATLEGSVSYKGEKMVIYATSNRRHLIKENFSDREGDDIHRNDTMQETLSLSARFGLRVNFSRPDKKDFLSIVRSLAQANNIEIPTDELELQAEQFAISSGSGRSPRTAKQFINNIINKK